jgi:CpeT protein
MRILLLLVASMLLASCDQDKKSENQQDPTSDRLATLHNWMAGEFSSAEQAAQDTNYFDITLRMIPVWEDQEDTYWLYVEQAMSTMLDRPYRQRVYQLEAQDSSHFSSTVYTLPNPKAFVGSMPGDSLWAGISPDSLKLLEGCAIYLEYKNGTFIGETHESDCLNSWGDAAYATSEVSIKASELKSWDRGWDSAGSQVWGAENGGYVFVKK